MHISVLCPFSKQCVHVLIDLSPYPWCLLRKNGSLPTFFWSCSKGVLSDRGGTSGSVNP